MLCRLSIVLLNWGRIWSSPWLQTLAVILIPRLKLNETKGWRTWRVHSGMRPVSWVLPWSGSIRFEAKSNGDDIREQEIWACIGRVPGVVCSLCMQLVYYWGAHREGSVWVEGGFLFGIILSWRRIDPRILSSFLPLLFLSFYLTLSRIYSSLNFTNSIVAANLSSWARNPQAESS